MYDIIATEVYSCSFKCVHWTVNLSSLRLTEFSNANKQLILHKYRFDIHKYILNKVTIKAAQQSAALAWSNEKQIGSMKRDQWQISIKQFCDSWTHEQAAECHNRWYNIKKPFRLSLTHSLLFIIDWMAEAYNNKKL